MADYITAITGLINMTSGLSMGMLLFYLVAAVLCILAWKLPELIKACRKAKDDD
jgi:hypothetical protein